MVVRCSGTDSDGLVSEAGDFGAVTVHTVVDEVLSDFGPEAWGDTIVALINGLDPEAVLACGTERGNEVMAQAAARIVNPRFGLGQIDVADIDSLLLEERLVEERMPNQ